MYQSKYEAHKHFKDTRSFHYDPYQFCKITGKQYSPFSSFQLLIDIKI